MLTKNEIKHIVELQRKKNRQISHQFVVEGEKMVEEALKFCPNSIVRLFVLQEFIDNQKDINVETQVISEHELKQISTLKTPHKALAILQQDENDVLAADFYLALDGIQDPGNLGTIIRLADWFGLRQIICSSDCVDCYNPKVVQATMGSIFRVRLHYVDLGEFLSAKKLPVYGALLQGKNVYQQKLERKGILLMGNEGNGIRDEYLEKITHPITIPRFGEAESLNVGVATAVLLSEFSRNL